MVLSGNMKMMSEQKYQNKLTKELESKGYYVLKLIKTSKNGIPDLLAIKKNKVLFVEVKAANGKLSELQKFRIKELNDNEIEAIVKYAPKKTR